MWPYSVQNFFYEFGGVVFESYFLWLPLILAFLLWKLWVYYVRFIFLTNLKWTLLEIKLPREIAKSPQAMELVFNVLQQTKDGNFLEKYWQGWLRPWFSLEIIGTGNKVRFFVYTQEFFKEMVKQQIYAQYPDVEIAETDDYVKEFFDKNDGSEWNLFGVEFKLTAPDPYPIKTYVDYGLHNLATEEEQKTDPITSFIEFLGSLKDGEQVWFQILSRATKADWQNAGKEIIDKIMKRDIKPKEGEIDFGSLSVSPGERTIAEAIERDVSKLGFDVGMRAIYLAKSGIFNKINVASMIGAMKHYNSMNLNGFKPVNSTGVDYFFVKKREARLKRRMIDAFYRRSYFYPPYVRKTFILNTEELATIFHLPGGVAETPALVRVEAKKSEPPPDLPV